ncbi:aspartate-alanine antiporter, partial [Francisella tularensis subsp. holarctica]|nr:aspartate-alanine antiporter [Francisella tularensis subsp. holarctica]
GPILRLATIFPVVKKWDLRHEASQLAIEQSDGNLDLEVGQFSAFSEYPTRAYKINRDSLLLGKSVVEGYKTYQDRGV